MTAPGRTTRLDILLGASVLIFLVAGDVWFPTGSAWRFARLPVLALALASGAFVLLRHPSALRALGRAPIVFFSVFAAIDLVASVAGEHPLSSLRYAAGYLAVAGLAVALAGRFSDRALVNGLLASLVAKLAFSLSLATSSYAWWWNSRFQGILGNPNPMGAAAGMAYLLIVLHGWYDYRRKASRIALLAAALAATCVMAATQSLSALGATLGTLVLLAPFSRLREATWRERVEWAIVAVALLAPLVMIGGSGTGGAALPRQTTPVQSVSFRSGWWVMLEAAIARHPWLGYGAGSTPSLGIEGAPYWGTSAHNLYLEAAVYAGVPAAIAMLAFIAAACLFAVRRAWRHPGGARVGVAVPIVFYAVLSLAEPVVLNGAPSSLVVPLVAAAVCSMSAGSVSRDADR
jgi:O-antigen ligase